MSLAIDVDKVTEVLLSDGWHICEFRKDGKRHVSTFAMDAYEYLWRSDPGDQWDFQLVAHGTEAMGYTGFSFIEAGAQVCGPLVSIIAVKTLAPPRGR